MKTYSLLLRILCSALLTACSAVGALTKPNILLIVGDDMGYADVGFHGCKDIPTPNLDALAASGVRFTSGYVSAPVCSPTRAGLLTGRYQQRFGHEFNPGDSVPECMALTEATLADRLKAAGYATGLVGKWHVGSNRAEMRPLKRGFDEFFGFLSGGHPYFPGPGSAMRCGEEKIKEPEYLTDAFAREAVAFIDRHASTGSAQTKPWFLYLAFNAVHGPMHATEDRLAKFSGIADMTRRTQVAMMSAMDDAIGRVRKKLADEGLDRNTLIIFINDNGGPTWPETSANGSCNAPLRGCKATTLEGGIRVPFVVSWPGHIKPGVYDQPVIQFDAHATALAAAGVKIKPEWELDGVNLLPFLAGAQAGAPHTALYWRFGQQMAIRVGDYKLVRYPSVVDTLTGNLKESTVTDARLYRLSNDIGETTDLAATMPEKARELAVKWEAWNSTLRDPLFGAGSAKWAQPQRSGDRNGAKSPGGKGGKMKTDGA